MKPYEESDRYNYPLNAESFVIDAGGYHGNWAAEIDKLFGCKILIFEPVERFYLGLVERFKDRPNIGVKDAGLGGLDCTAGKEFEFHVQNDSSGKFAGSCDVELVELFSASYVIGNLDHHVDLLKLNIEGLEYDVLNALLDKGLMVKIKYLQVQFHSNVPQAGDHREAIRRRLAETHELMYDAPFVWEGWKLK